MDPCPFPTPRTNAYEVNGPRTETSSLFPSARTSAWHQCALSKCEMNEGMHERGCHAAQGCRTEQFGPYGTRTVQAPSGPGGWTGTSLAVWEGLAFRQNPLPSALPYPGLAIHLAQPVTTRGNHLALEAVSAPQLSQVINGSISSPHQMVIFRAASVECTWEVFSQLTCLPSSPFFLSSPSGRVKSSSQSSRATWSSHLCPCLRLRPT